MEILVCVKRVPDTAENEIEVNSDGTDIERDDLVYSVNEWDNYAVEEAIQIKDNVGGSVTVVSVGDEESEEVVRREMAMGADNGILLSDDAFEGSDGKGLASLLKAAVEKGKYDLILTGAQADDHLIIAETLAIQEQGHQVVVREIAFCQLRQLLGAGPFETARQR